MSVGPIPWTAIFAYCQLHKLDDTEQDDLFYFVHELDSKYIEYQNKD